VIFDPSYPNTNVRVQFKHYSADRIRKSVIVTSS